MRLPRILQQFILQSIVWSALCFATEAVCRALHWGYPYDYFAVPAVHRFGDFSIFQQAFATFHSRQFFGPGYVPLYPAPLLVFYKLFFLFPMSRHPSLVVWRFEGFIVAVSLAMAILFWRTLVGRGLAPWSATIFLIPAYFLAFPIWFEFHQGNMEVIVWVVMTIGLWAFWTDKPWVASIFFGIAAAMKIYPLVFLGLFLARKHYWPVMTAMATSAVTTVATLWLVCPDIAYAWKESNARIARFREMYMVRVMPMESGFDHSIFCVIKRLLPRTTPVERVSQLMTAYLAMAAIAVLAVFFLKLRKMPVVNQILCLSIAAILLPPTSFDYTLLQLYVPFALLVLVAIQSDAASSVTDMPKSLVFTFVLFAFLFAPQSEFVYHGLRYAGQIKAVALVALLVVGLLYKFPIDAERTSDALDAGIRIS